MKTLFCPEVLTIREVAGFFAEAKTALEAGPVTLDVSRLTELDGAGAQLLHLLTRPGAEPRAILAEPSAVMSEVGRVLGLFREVRP